MRLADALAAHAAARRALRCARRWDVFQHGGQPGRRGGVRGLVAAEVEQAGAANALRMRCGLLSQPRVGLELLQGRTQGVGI
eukprot:224337-Chlamydomonas_euryale.AAC.7